MKRYLQIRQLQIMTAISIKIQSVRCTLQWELEVQNCTELSGKAPYIATQYNGFGFLDMSLTNNGRNLTGIFYSTNNRSIEDIFTGLK